MTIKGTLETFNLLDLLQMLSFNQKEGTLALETARGPRTLYVKKGNFGFVQGDLLPSRALARVLRRKASVPADRLERGLKITTNSGRYLGDALAELGAIEPELRASASAEAVQELFFDLLQTPITRFEFVEGKRLAPDGTEGAAIQPMCAVDAVLLELARKIDEWSLLRQEVPTDDEVFETTRKAPDLAHLDRLADHVPERVLPLIDGRRNVTALVEGSDVDRFSVVKLLVTLLHQGVVAPVTTGELQARGEEALHRRLPKEAVPLLRRAVERADVAPAVRMRLAEALEAAGDAKAAAAEYDAHATACEGSDPNGAFTALRGALRIRGEDPATAARLCDVYLRQRERLHGRAEEARRALDIVIDAAEKRGNPAEPAARLAQLIEFGDVPSEDLLVLADLWAAAGRPADAATALVRRADVLVRQSRTGPARDALRRALTYDPSRLDVRRKVEELESQHRRRLSRRRLVVSLSVLGLTAASAGAAYLVHDGRAARAAESAVARAGLAATEAEDGAVRAQRSFQAVAQKAATGSADTAMLGAAATALREATQRVAGRLQADLVAVASELEERAGAGHAEAGLLRVRGMQVRGAALLERAEATIRDLGDRADRALEAGEAAFAAGRFGPARDPLVMAMRLSLPGEARAERAQRSLEQVDRYVARFAAARRAYDAADAKGDTDAAWREASKLFAEFLDSDLTQELRIAVPVEVEPVGAVVRLGPQGAPTPTPATIRYSPFGDLDLRLEAPGHVPTVVRLPSFAEIRGGAALGGLPPARVKATLPAGPRWTASATRIVAGPFVVGDGAWVLADEGRRLVAVRADGSTLDLPDEAQPKDRLRDVGRGGNGTWTTTGLRTFTYIPDGGRPWEHPMPGRMSLEPAFSGATVVLADDTGVVRAFDTRTGAGRFQATLPSAPVQGPQATPIGVAIATATGEVELIALESGRLQTLVPAVAGRPTLVAPWHDGALVIGGAEPGLAVHAKGGTVRSLGAASPVALQGVVATTTGCAWVETDGGVAWLGRATEGAGPLRLRGLGATDHAPAIAGETAYAIGRDQVLRAARLEAPDATAWSVALPGPALAPPAVCGDLILVRTAAGLVAYAR